MTAVRLPLVAAAVVLATLAAGSEAFAQRCSTDMDCQRTGLRQDARCVGDTLVVTERRCVGGSCRALERRQSCGTGGAGRCIGNVFEATIGRCDALLGRCVRRAERDVCISSCTCRNNILIVATERCSPNIGCHRGRIVCESGCTCEPEPRCLDERESPDNADRKQEEPAKKN